MTRFQLVKHEQVTYTINMSEQIRELSELPKELVKDGSQFLKRCQKPNVKEFMGIAQAVSVGFLIMGFVGFFVKLIHIPINNVLGMLTFYVIKLTNSRRELKQYVR